MSICKLLSKDVFRIRKYTIIKRLRFFREPDFFLIFRLRLNIKKVLPETFFFVLMYNFKTKRSERIF